MNELLFLNSFPFSVLRILNVIKNLQSTSGGRLVEETQVFLRLYILYLKS